ncbi:MAG: hypothetical protein ABR548_10965 [Actinomycetota bacterium]
MRHKWAIVSAAAIVGAAALVVAPLAANAPAQAGLPIYSVRGASKGIEIQFALRPNIFDPLLQVAAGYAATNVNSSGGGSGDALGSSVYPGSLVIGARGCDGMPGTAQASFPANKRCGTKHAHDDNAFIPLQNEDQFGIVTAHQTADAVLGVSRSTAKVEHLFFNPSKDVSISVAGLSVVSESRLGSAGVQQATTSTVTGIKIAVPSFVLDISTFVSRAVSTSDGDEGVAEGTLTFGDVFATVNGEKHRAYIDNKGVHIGKASVPNPTPLTVPDDAGGDISFSDAPQLGRAGVSIRLANPTRIEDGSRAESSVGGLVIAFETGRPPYPPVPPPPVQIPQIENHCFTSDNPIPLPSPFPSTNPLAGFCIGQGVLPIPPGNAAMSFAIGGADALAVASHGFQFNPGGGINVPKLPSGPTGGFPGGLPGGTGSTTGGSQPGSTVTPGTGGTAQQPVQLLGRVARMPSGALVGSGLFFIVLALGLAWAPSLRP